MDGLLTLEEEIEIRNNKAEWKFEDTEPREYRNRKKIHYVIIVLLFQKQSP